MDYWDTASCCFAANRPRAKGTSTLSVCKLLLMAGVLITWLTSCAAVSETVAPTPAKGAAPETVTTVPTNEPGLQRLDSTPVDEPVPETVIEISMPTSYEVPPEDVLQQISFFMGGGDGYCQRHCSFGFGQGLILYGFEPNERLRVFVYEHTGRLMSTCESDDGRVYSVSRYVTDWNVTVDDSGSLWIKTDLRNQLGEFQFVVTHPDTGEIVGEWMSMIEHLLIPGRAWGANSTVRANTGDAWLDIHAEPGYDSRVLAQIAHCETMILIGDSALVDGERWWPVRLNNQVEGWVTELWIAPTTQILSSEEENQVFKVPGFQVPPSDVLQQIAFYPSGGPQPCQGSCIFYADNELRLEGFKPDQSVRIIVCEITERGPNTEDTYGGVCRFLAEWHVTVGSTGNLSLQVADADLAQHQFIAVDVTSSEIVADTMPFMYSPVIPYGGWVAGDIVVANSGEDRLHIRNGPGYRNPIIAKVHHGDKMTVRGHPEVVTGERWWPVRLDNGIEGWVTELWIAPVR